MKPGNAVKFKNSLNYDKGIANKVGNSTIKKIIPVNTQKEADELSIMVGQYFKRKKSPIDVAILDSNIAVPVSLLSLNENSTINNGRRISKNNKKPEMENKNSSELLEGIIRKLVKEELLAEERLIGRVLGYDVGLFEDGSLIIANDSGNIVVRITNKKFAERFAKYVNTAISRMK